MSQQTVHFLCLLETKIKLELSTIFCTTTGSPAQQTYQELLCSGFRTAVTPIRQRFLELNDYIRTGRVWDRGSEALSLVARLVIAAMLAPRLRMTHLLLALPFDLVLCSLSVTDACEVVIDSCMHVPLVIDGSK